MKVLFGFLGIFLSVAENNVHITAYSTLKAIKLELGVFPKIFVSSI